MTIPLILVVVGFGWRVLLHFMTLVYFFLFYPLNSIPLTSRLLTLAFFNIKRNKNKLLIKAVKGRSRKAEKGSLRIHSDWILLVVLVYFLIFVCAERLNRHSSGYLLVEILPCNHSWGNCIYRQSQLMFVYCMSWVVCETEVIKMAS